MKKPSSPPILITTQEQLAEIAADLLTQTIVGVDTESNSLFAYKEQVCLIQFSVPGKDYLVDTVVLRDLSVLNPFFADPKIEKIFHAAEYDILTLKRDFKFEFRNLFDTMVAARILGYQRVGLGNLLNEVFGIKLEKKYQRADWGKRPLDKGMLSYARMDTYYLFKLRNILKADLERKKRSLIAEEDFLRLTQLNGASPEPPQKEIWRMSGVRDLTPQQNAVLIELAKYRQKQAAKRNRPLFKIIGDKSLVAIAEDLPANLHEMSTLPGMTPQQISWHGKALQAAIKRGLANEPVKRPRKVKPEEDFLISYENLRQWRKATAQNMNVESDVILPRDIMETLAQRRPYTMKEVAEIMATLPYRLERYGEVILSELMNR